MQGRPALPTADDLAAAWPEVSRRLARLLTARRADAHLVPDLVQEVGLRLLERRPPFDDVDHLYRYAAQIARNLHVDHLRRAQPAVADQEVLVSLPAACDVERHVEAKLHLQAVTRVLAGMALRDRQLLRDAVADGSTTVHVNDRVALHRARKRLVAALESCWTWAGVALLAVARAGRRSAGPLSTASVAAAAAAIIIVPALPGDDALARPVPSVEAARQLRTHGAPRAAHRTADVPRPARAASVRVPHRLTAPAAPHRATDVSTPVGLGAHHSQRPRTSSDSVLCVFGVPGQRTLCLPRKFPTDL